MNALGFADLRSLAFLLISLPVLVGLLSLMWPRVRPWLPLAAVLIPLVQTGAALSLWSQLWEGRFPVVARLEGVIYHGISVQVDEISRLFVLIASVLWCLAALYARSYMQSDKSRGRFYTWFLITLGACQGVFLAGDLFTLFILFEVMSFASYALVVHTQEPRAMASGNLYIFMGMAGGLMLFLGVAIVNFLAGTTAFVPSLEVLSARVNPYVLAGLFLAAFGVKAGMVPVHFWLPRAHPVAPAPASALLSGVLIKTGLYGIIRTLGFVLRPESASSPLWQTWERMGSVLLVLAVLTIFTGALSALLEPEPKRLLAYSSVSQMGYLLLGVGAAIRYPKIGGLAFGGALMHMLSHAVFKSGLFMMAGARLSGYDWGKNRLRGMLPLVVCLAGLAAVPGMNGFASKKLLSHAIEKAQHHYPSHETWLVSFLFSVAGAMTACYAIRLASMLLSPSAHAGDHHSGHEIDWRHAKVVFMASSLLVIIAGAFPEALLQRLVMPAVLATAPYTKSAAALLDERFYTASNLLAMVPVLVAAVLLYFIGVKTNLFKLRMPGVLNADVLFIRPFVRLLTFALNTGYAILDRGVNRGYERLPGCMQLMVRRLAEMDQAVCWGYDEAGRLAGTATTTMLKVDVMINKGYDSAEKVAGDTARSALRMDQMLDRAFDRIGDGASRAVGKAGSINQVFERAYDQIESIATDDLGTSRQVINSQPNAFRWNSVNLNTAALLMALVLMLFLMGLMASGYMMTV